MAQMKSMKSQATRLTSKRPRGASRILGRRSKTMQRSPHLADLLADKSKKGINEPGEIKALVEKLIIAVPESSPLTSPIQIAQPSESEASQADVALIMVHFDVNFTIAIAQGNSKAGGIVDVLEDLKEKVESD